MTLAEGVRFLLPLLLRDQLFRRSDIARATTELHRLRKGGRYSSISRAARSSGISAWSLVFLIR